MDYADGGDLQKMIQ
jgi:NIMA (never in mitosis gene a)-related kinase 1/4/5